MNHNATDNYGWHDAAYPDSCTFVAPFAKKILKKLNVKRVVDLGAGNGALCDVLHSEGYDVVGVEYDKKGYEIAQKAHPDIRFYNLGVGDDPQPVLDNEQKFEAVISTEVVEHLFSPHHLPIFARAIVKDGGYLIISTPYHGYLKNLLLSIFNHWDYHLSALWHGGHIKFWSRKTLTKLLSDNGFEVVEFYGDGNMNIPYLWRTMFLVAKAV